VRRKVADFVNFSLVFVIVCSSVVIAQPVKVDAVDPYFTLVFKTNSGGVYPDYGNFLKQHLAQIGINVDVIVLDWPTFVGELLSYHNFDICYVGIKGGGNDPDFTGVYNENGSLNLFGYDTSMDWSSSLGTGKNEWYMKQGTQIMPPNSAERIQHYWDWQEYLMDKICPLVPLFTTNNVDAYWANLNGYNVTDGLLQSWGKMSWTGTHTGQTNVNQIVLTDAAWTDLNPLFQDDEQSRYVSSLCLDPLFWFDADMTFWPHLAESYTFLNDTTILIDIRDGIFWPDVDSFTNEPFDNEDIYFTYYVWKHLSNYQQEYDWIKDMDLIGSDQLIIYIDGDDSTPKNDPYAPSIKYLTKGILPEHYLNQTQIHGGVIPDLTHHSWNTFAVNCFGTSLFEITSFTESVETILSVNPNCWWLDPTVDKSNMDFVDRFGDFSGGLTSQRIRMIPDLQTTILEFEAGKIDIYNVKYDSEKQAEYAADPTKNIQSGSSFQIGFFGFNMRESRLKMGDRTPCDFEPTISKGLALRKAISFAVNRDQINNVIHNGNNSIVHWPIYSKLGFWCNPNIIRYDYNLILAEYYLALAGYGNSSLITTPLTTTSIGLATTVFISLLVGSFVLVSFFNRKRK